MRCQSALLLVSSVWVGYASAQAAPQNLGGPLTIVLRSDLACSVEVVNAMERETESLVAPSSIRLTWTTATRRGEVYQRVAVVRLRGPCQVDGLAAKPFRAESSGPVPLAQTQVVDGKVLPFADVRCDAVGQFIGRDLSLQPSYQRDDLFGRALGRVLAHELFHILLRTTAHGTQGLARPVQTSGDLLADRDSFAPVDERKLSDISSVEVTESFDSTGR